MASPLAPAAVVAMMSWRLARSIDTLRDEVNGRWPDRDKASDGTIGDAAHASRNSDHNPWIIDANGVGVVRAIDIDRDLTDDRGGPTDTVPGELDIEWLAEHLRHLGRLGDPRVRYVIWNALIASPREGWRWRRYTGVNAHRSHVHLSVSTDPAAYDSDAPWGVHPTTTTIDPKDWLMALSDKQQQELYDKTNANHLYLKALYDDYGRKGRSMRQVILVAAERLRRLVGVTTGIDGKVDELLEPDDAADPVED